MLYLLLLTQSINTSTNHRWSCRDNYLLPFQISLVSIITMIHLQFQQTWISTNKHFHYISIVIYLERWMVKTATIQNMCDHITMCRTKNWLERSHQVPSHRPIDHNPISFHFCDKQSTCGNRSWDANWSLHFLKSSILFYIPRRTAHSRQGIFRK